MGKRDSSIELLRVLATVMVITLHILGQGGILSHASPEGATYWVAWLLEICAYCAVNCFALISGYVLADRGVRIKSILLLWLQAALYSTVISAVFFVTAPETFTAKNIIVAIFPIIGRQWWYLSSYFAMIALVPLINKGVQLFSEKALGVIPATVLLLIGVLDCAVSGLFGIDAFALRGGYSAIWLIIMYLFGAYLKKRSERSKLTATVALLGYLSAIAVTFLSKLVIHFVTKHRLGSVTHDGILISYTSFTIILSSVFLFLFCRKLRLGRIAKELTELLAPTTLGVYLIHTHPLVFEHLIKNAFVPFLDKPLPLTVLLIAITVAAVFVLCAAVELLRIQLFRLLGINKLCEYADNKITAFFTGKNNASKAE